jgi:hypothetical protein
MRRGNADLCSALEGESAVDSGTASNQKKPAK